VKKYMPRGDGTGPMGQGPMTGRGLGYCAGYPNPGFMQPVPGFGRGFGRGWGRGFGRGFRWRWFNRPFYRYPAQPVYPVRYPATPTYPPTYPVEPISLTKQEQVKILEQEKKELELDIKAIKDEIEAIGKRIKELK
jgi:hypothetical protein